MSPISVHLICNAHLDPVWQWRWDEGASEALATFRNAVDILDDHPSLIFCHNEAVLYQWAERLDPDLFRAILRHVRSRRWAVAGGWFIQPDVNLPGTESLVRTIAEGRRYFRETFGAAPLVAYNFDSFGHSGGLPQILKLAGFEMYVHMRPQADELELPADLYRWRGLDGTTIPAYRIAVGLYHTEHDNVEERLRAGVELALTLGRDVPVFWGLGNHGGGATRRDLETIDAFIARESRVRVIHSTPDRFFEAVKAAAATAPVFEGDLQRCFTGCYTSLSRLKRRAVESLGRLVQAEAAAAASSWLRGAIFPEPALGEAWKFHIFNDFHDILTGTCIEPAERDALAQYGRADDIARSTALQAAAALNLGSRNSPSLPVTVFNANPSMRRAPVEFECMADHRPFWKGRWRIRLFRPDGREIPCQEEQPESLLPFNNWRRRISFMDDLPGVGVARYLLKAFEIPEPPSGTGRGPRPGPRIPGSSALEHRLDRRTGLVASLKIRSGGKARECLRGPLFEPIAVEDAADSWGTGRGNYRRVVGRFRPAGPSAVIERGPVRTVTRSILVQGRNRAVMDVFSYPGCPVLEFRFRVTWNDERRRLKLRVPTALDAPTLLAEVPGGAIRRPAGGEEHVHGRWLVVAAASRGKTAAVGIASSGQHGLDFADGEVRLSVLRSSAYCHERGFDLDALVPPEGKRVPQRDPRPSPSGWRFADIGVHEFRLIATAGSIAQVTSMMPGLADHLAAPPAVYAHLPYDAQRVGPAEPLLALRPSSIRLLACKISRDGGALVVRIQEAVGSGTEGELAVALPPPREEDHRGRASEVQIPLNLGAFEMRTLRIEKDGTWRSVGLAEEDAA